MDVTSLLPLLEQSPMIAVLVWVLVSSRKESRDREERHEASDAARDQRFVEALQKVEAGCQETQSKAIDAIQRNTEVLAVVLDRLPRA